MSKPSLREVMPWTASIIDEWREAFGVEAVNKIIARGTAGGGGFHAQESGVEIGSKGIQPVQDGPIVQWDPERAVKVGDMVLGEANVKRSKR